jgi:hypothetical protein
MVDSRLSSYDCDHIPKRVAISRPSVKHEGFVILSAAKHLLFELRHGKCDKPVTSK